VGGDFNVAPGDKVFHEFGDALKDTFDEGGRGWCNTIVDSMPLLRIDQIWTNQQLRCVNAHAINAPKTDHKMYVAELIDRTPYTPTTVQ